MYYYYPMYPQYSPGLRYPEGYNLKDAPLSHYHNYVTPLQDEQLTGLEERGNKVEISAQDYRNAGSVNDVSLQDNVKQQSAAMKKREEKVNTMSFQNKESTNIDERNITELMYRELQAIRKVLEEMQLNNN